MSAEKGFIVNAAEKFLEERKQAKKAELGADGYKRYQEQLPWNAPALRPAKAAIAKVIQYGHKVVDAFPDPPKFK